MNFQQHPKNESPPYDCSLHATVESAGEKPLLSVIVISIIAMIGEIVGGNLFGSMALLADGWHMGTHVLALGIAYGAILLAKRFARDLRFAFGPAKVGALGGFSGAILLTVVAFQMIGEGVHRLIAPETILFTEAMTVALIGLVVNLVGAVLLHKSVHRHSHNHDDSTSAPQNAVVHTGHGHDTNMQSAYLHVITDALTSVLAIAALFLGKQFGWSWADAGVAILGGAIILKWSYGLLTSSGATLLDFVPNYTVHSEIERAISAGTETEITDLHIWPQGNHFSVLATVTAHNAQEKAETIHQRLKKLNYLKHITIEVRSCDCC